MIDTYTQVAFCDQTTHTCVDKGCVQLGGLCSPDYPQTARPPCCNAQTSPATCGAPELDPNLTHQCFLAQGPPCASIGVPCAQLPCCIGEGNLVCDPQTTKCVLQ
jgi:hypothetical protein